MRNHGRLLAVWIAALAVTASAQNFDDLSDSFPPPPPPPPPGVSPKAPPVQNSPGQPGRTTKDTKDGVLQGMQKERFAKAPIEDITDENFPETIESFDFPNADIQDIVKAISELTGRNFIIDPGVRGKITVLAPSKITVAEAYKAFLSALAINGYAIVPSGSFFKIRTARNAQRDGIETFWGQYHPSSDQMVTKIFHLKHIQAEVVNRELRLLQSKDGELSIYPPTNSIIISDYGANIDRISRIFAQLDVPGFEDQLEVIRVRFAKAKDMAELINKIVNKGERQQQGQPGAFTAGVPRFGRTTGQGNQGSAYFMVIPDDRTNSLITSGNKAGIDRIKKLLLQLDRKMDPGDAGGVHVYYVKYGDAKKIATTLSGVAKDAGPKPAAGGGATPGAPMVSPISGVQNTQTEIFSGDVKINADEGTNSLVIVASKQDYETVLGLLSKIDIQRDQVYIEAVIMELSASDNLDYQIGYFNYIGTNGLHAGFNGIDTTTLSNLINPIGGTGAILPFGSGTPVNVTTINPAGGAGTTFTIPNLLGFINFLKKNINGNVLSTPSILTLDAMEGEISVGDRVVVGLQQSVAAVGTVAPPPIPQFEDANTVLTVKPFISAEDRNIRMEVKAEIKQPSSSPTTPKGLADTTQQLATRKVKTNIIVPHGDTAVLGGLTRSGEAEIISKVPLLGDIPILGWLFKSRNIQHTKTNLLLFLTPRIVHSHEDHRKLLSKKADERLNFIKDTGGRDVFGEKMDELMGVQAGNPAPLK